MPCVFSGDDATFGNGLWYELQGDYYIPCLTLDNADDQPVGMWGRKYLRYIKEHRPVLHTTLLLSGKLNSHLAEIDNRASGCETVLDQLYQVLYRIPLEIADGFKELEELRCNLPLDDNNAVFHILIFLKQFISILENSPD